MSIISKIVLTKKAKKEIDEFLLNELLKIVLVKRIEFELNNQKFDYLQILDFCKDEETGLKCVIHRQENHPEENLKGFKEKFILDISDNLIGKTIYFTFAEDEYRKECNCTILFNDEW